MQLKNIETCNFEYKQRLSEESEITFFSTLFQAMLPPKVHCLYGGGPDNIKQAILILWESGVITSYSL